MCQLELLPKKGNRPYSQTPYYEAVSSLLGKHDPLGSLCTPSPQEQCRRVLQNYSYLPDSNMREDKC